jgi:hypothetical protein
MIREKHIELKKEAIFSDGTKSPCCKTKAQSPKRGWDGKSWFQKGIKPELEEKKKGNHNGTLKKPDARPSEEETEPENKTKKVDYIIWSWVRPVGSWPSIMSSWCEAPGIMYLTKVIPRGRPPY